MMTSILYFYDIFIVKKIRRKENAIYTIVDTLDMGRCFNGMKSVRKLRIENSMKIDAEIHASVSSTTRGFRVLQSQFTLSSRGFVMFPVEVIVFIVNYLLILIFCSVLCQ